MSYTTERPRGRLPQGKLIVPGWPDIEGLGIPVHSAGTANRGYYQPFVMPYTTSLVSIEFWNSSGTNNHDLGLYDAVGNRLGSKGSTASTANTIHIWTPSTPIAVQAGKLYFAAFATAGTATILAYSGNGMYNPRTGRAVQASALALPNPATFAAAGADAFIPVLKLTFTE